MGLMPKEVMKASRGERLPPGPKPPPRVSMSPMGLLLLSPLSPPPSFGGGLCVFCCV